MGRVHDAVCDALAAEISSREQWDEPPEILTMYYTGGRCRLGHLWLPDAVWATGPPAQILAGLASAASDRAGLLQAVAPGELHGVAFRTEIWMATAKAGTAADADLRKRVEAADHRVSKLADRVEARAIWAVDRAGINYSVIHVRGEAEAVRAMTYPKAGQPQLDAVSGTIPDALDKLVTAFLGVPLPRRERVR